MDNTQNRIENINDPVRHGLDDNSNNDPEKGAALGGLGGAAVGAAAGSIAGPVGTIVGAIAGGLVGAGASGAAVAAVDAIDNDNTISGVGEGVTRDSDATRVDADNIRMSSDAPVSTGAHGHNIVTGEPARTGAGDTGLAGGAIVGGIVGAAVGGPVGAVVGGTLGSLAGGVAGDAAEAADETDLARDNNYSGGAYQADAAMNPAINPAINPMTARPIDDVLKPSEQTDYRSVDEGMTSIGSTNENADTAVLGVTDTPGVRSGSDIDAPGVQTGGRTTQGPDTRGLMEKTADAISGDNVDDKTGGSVLNDPNKR